MITLLVLPGDGIGPEIVSAACGILEVLAARHGFALDLQRRAIGFDALAAEGTTLPDGVLDQARAADGVILGPISHMDYPPRSQGGVNVSAAFRVELDLYANVRPARTRPGLGRGHAPLDLVIMREATEGFYPDRNMAAGSGEFMPTPDVALSVRKITAHASTRIARRAFALARRRRARVTVAHKANAFILTDGLWLRCVREVARDFPDVLLDELIVDACAAWLVRDPARFDVLLTTNFHGDILSDLASELSGGLGLAGSLLEGDVLACAQAQHGSAPDIAGQDRANPTSMLLSVAMLLDWLGARRGEASLRAAAAALDTAIDAALADPATRTADLGGTLGTRGFTDQLAARLA